METLYQRLRLTNKASPADIRRSYHKLAMIFHPDRCDGDKTNSHEFHKIVAAFEILGNPQKRALYDQGKIDNSGAFISVNPTVVHSQDKTKNAQRTCKNNCHTCKKSRDFSDLVDRLKRAADIKITPSSSKDKPTTLLIDFMEAVFGCARKLMMPDGENLSINIPAGVREGQILRLRKRQEEHSYYHIKISVEPHILFTRKGNDIHLDLDITPYEAMLGARLEVPTLDGKTVITLPNKVKDGQLFRLKGRGIRSGQGTGDMLIRARVCLPEGWPVGLKSMMQLWRQKAPYNPRAKFRQLLAR